MKRLRFLVLLLAVMMTVSVCAMAAQAATVKESYTVQAGIEFYDDSSGGGNGGGNNGGGGGGSGNRSSGNGGSNIRSPATPTSFGDGGDTVTIVDPEIPLGDIGPLAQTGGGLLVPLILVTAGIWLLYAALRLEQKRPGTAA